MVLIRSACTQVTNTARKQFWFCNHTTVDGSMQGLERAPESGPWERHLGEEEWSGGGRGRGWQRRGGDNDNNWGMHNNYTII